MIKKEKQAIKKFIIKIILFIMFIVLIFSAGRMTALETGMRQGVSQAKIIIDEYCKDKKMYDLYCNNYNVYNFSEDDNIFNYNITVGGIK